MASAGLPTRLQSHACAWDWLTRHAALVASGVLSSRAYVPVGGDTVGDAILLASQSDVLGPLVMLFLYKGQWMSEECNDGIHTVAHAWSH